MKKCVIVLVFVISFGALILGQTFEPLYTVPANDIEIGETGVLWSVAQMHIAYKLELATGNTIGTLPFNIPAENDGRGIAWDGTSLWYSEWDFDKIYKIDISTGNVLMEFNSPGFGPQALAFGGGYLWHTDEYTDDIYKIDPANGTVVDTLPSPEPSAWFVGIAYCNGNLWLASVVTGKLYQISATTGAVITSIQFPYGTMGDITCDNSYLYISSDQQLYRMLISPADAHSSLKLLAGTINGTTLNLTSPVINVEPGATISGSVTLQSVNLWDPSSVAPLAGTPSWGIHSTSFWGINSWISTGTSSYSTDISVTAPTQPGVYFIFFAFSAELSYANVMSLTNWSHSGGNVWDDGVDVADWTEAQANFALDSGYVNTQYLGGNGTYNTEKVPGVGIKIIIPDQPNLLVFSEDFNNYPNWNIAGDPNFLNYPILDWSHGNSSFPYPPPIPHYVQIQDGVIYGVGEGYGSQPADGHIDKEINLDGSEGFVLEFRAKSASDCPNRTSVYLLSNYDENNTTNNEANVSGYELNIYGESANYTIDLAKYPIPPNIWPTYRLYVGPGILEYWHTYKLQRNQQGDWKLFIDEVEISNFNPPADLSFNSFNRIAVYAMRSGSMIDWIKLYQGNVTGISELETIRNYHLSQNYPNPFNPSTTIEYQLPNNSQVTLSVYNSLGQLVNTLVNEEKDAGYYQAVWNGNDNHGNQVASGIYFYRLQTGNFINTKKMILLR